ncbi:MAG: hypothetical protein ACP5N9_01615 [Candidatus Bilamarchaeum sp.]|jgi:hypothetical protein
MPNSNPEVNTVIGDLSADCPIKRRHAAQAAQYLVLKPLPPQPAARLLDVLAVKLHISDGKPAEDCEFVRERVANAFELAHDAGHDVFGYVNHLRVAAANDPHKWVREAASSALKFIDEHRPFGPGPVRIPPSGARESRAKVKA